MLVLESTSFFVPVKSCATSHFLLTAFAVYSKYALASSIAKFFSSIQSYIITTLCTVFVRWVVDLCRGLVDRIDNVFLLFGNLHVRHLRHRYTAHSFLFPSGTMLTALSWVVYAAMDTTSLIDSVHAPLESTNCPLTTAAF